jgi:hypothetical protein
MRQTDLSEFERGRRAIPDDFEPRLWKALVQ